jgi:AcrR family transcriptional regulator
MASDTRQRLIDAAKQRFYRDGFRNVGIDAILADVGISKTAFYKHFESKDDLVVAVLDSVDAFLQQQFQQMVKDRGGPGALGQLRALMDVVQSVIEDEQFHGCIFVNAAMEFPLPHDPAHAASLRHKRAIEEFVQELGERAHVPDPAALAAELCMIIEGTYVTRTITNDPATIAIARRLADQTIARQVPAVTSP